MLEWPNGTGDWTDGILLEMDRGSRGCRGGCRGGGGCRRDEVLLNAARDGSI